jgi:hypothetical protein
MTSTRSYIEFYLTCEGWTSTSWHAVNKIGEMPADCLVGLQLEQWDVEQRDDYVYEVRLLKIEAQQTTVTAFEKFGIPILITESHPEIENEIQKILHLAVVDQP